MNSRTTVVVAILVVMLILVAIEAVAGPFGGFRDSNDEGDNGIGPRCVAAGGHVSGHGAKASCVGADGRVISLP
jgi:hypothetical protein